MSSTNPQIQIAVDALYAALSSCQVHPDADLNQANAETTTIESLALDSIDLLQLAMVVEEELGIEMDIVKFPADATLLEVAQSFHKIMLNDGTGSK